MCMYDHKHTYACMSVIKMMHFTTYIMQFLSYVHMYICTYVQVAHDQCLYLQYSPATYNFIIHYASLISAVVCYVTWLHIPCP